MARAKTGRRRKLTPKLVEEARRLASEFRTDKEIYTCLGISESAFYSWKAADTEEGKAFLEALEKGREEYLQRIERECLERIISADSWQSDAWVLERLMPEKYGRCDRLKAEIEAETKNEINIIIEE